MKAERPNPEPPPSPFLRSRVDIAGAIADAEVSLAADSVDDGPYGELMANYSEWGKMLEQWNCGVFAGSGEEFEAACREHLEYSIALGKRHDRHAEQRWTVFVARAEAGLSPWTGGA